MNYAKRIALTPTRAGLQERVFFICYYCPAEFEHEHEAQEHDCLTT